MTCCPQIPNLFTQKLPRRVFNSLDLIKKSSPPGVERRLVDAEQLGRVLIKRVWGAAVIPMSALPPKADMCAATTDVRYGPLADIALFDQLVGAG
jgi:hypothetical protein